MKSKLKMVLSIGLFSLLVSLTALILISCGSESKHGWATSAAREDGGVVGLQALPHSRSATPGTAITPGAPGAPGAPGVASAISPGEELWVIVKPAVRVDDRSDGAPGSGVLVTEQPRDPQRPDGEKETVPVPLKHTDVKARIEAYIATVDVTQQFHNPYAGKIEAVYVFPLPDNAAVTEFVMSIGERRIRGIIREREEAEKIYLAARSQGFNAALMTQERPNIFTQKVANIEPGKQIDIHIRYFHTLAYADGWYEFHFPMVVGPRYNPAATAAQGDGIGAVGPNSGGLSGQRTEVPYLKPGTRSGHDISMFVDLIAGVRVEELVSPSHQIINSAGGPRLQVAIAKSDTIPNKDFVLRYRVAGETIKSNLLVHRDNRGGYFTLMLYPPKDLNHLPRRPMEMIFVVDCSGSMSGQPLDAAKNAIRHALKSMNPSDTFQVMSFAGEARMLGPRPMEVTDANLRGALSFVDDMQARGGTEMLSGIKAAFDYPQTPGRQRVVALLSDGYIGNETEILAEAHRRLGDSRIFSFGVGSSVNRHLMESLARIGRGAVAYVGPNDSGSEIMDHFFTRISRPALTDLEIDFGSMKVRDAFPRKTPDLFVGRPVLLVGRFEGEAPSQIRITGNAGGQRVAMNVNVEPVKLDPGATVNGRAIGGLPAVWARMQIQSLSDQMVHTRDPQGELPGVIKQLALDYSLMSAYTAFVAVDGSRRTEGDSGTTVPVPVPVPAGVKYETTVEE